MPARHWATAFRQDKTRQDKTRQDKTRQDKTRQDKTRQEKKRQDKTRQDKTRQDKKRQDKTRQDKKFILGLKETMQNARSTPDPTYNTFLTYSTQRLYIMLLKYMYLIF